MEQNSLGFWKLRIKILSQDSDYPVILDKNLISIVVQTLQCRSGATTLEASNLNIPSNFGTCDALISNYVMETTLTSNDFLSKKCKLHSAMFMSKMENNTCLKCSLYAIPI